jgi:hypothetical protein
MKLLNQSFQQHYHLGRFRTVRRTYSFVQGRLQQFSPRALQQLNQLNQLNHEVDQNESLFEPIALEDCVKQIRQQGVYLGIRLPKAIVDEVHQYARQNPCTEPGFEGNFWIDDVEDGHLPDGRPVLRGLVSNLADCSAIAKIIYDPQLMQVVRNYLGYIPTEISRHLTWSCATRLSEEEQKRRYPPANYHYDVAGLNFMAINFYITDVDQQSGPHVMMLNSHNRKPLSMVLASARQPDQAVLNYYGKENECVILGEQGFGFIQDSSCYHKVIPPVTQNRLFLQVRYA